MASALDEVTTLRGGADPAPTQPSKAPDLRADNPDIAGAGEGATAAQNPFDKPIGNGIPTIGEQDYAGAKAEVDAARQAASVGQGASQLIAEAKKYVGTPYVWGGSGPLGFDCSGFVQYVYKQMGVDLPRISYQQATYGKRIPLSELKPGDLVAWDYNGRNQGADHIAIYIGGGKIIEAPAPGKRVRITDLYSMGTSWGVQMGMG